MNISNAITKYPIIVKASFFYKTKKENCFIIRYYKYHIKYK